MTSASPTHAAAASALSTFRGAAFGLDVESEIAVPLLPSAVRDRAGARCVRLQALDGLGPSNGDTVFERRFPSGRPMLRIDRDEHGYRIWAPRHGRYAVAHDGRTIGMRVPASAGWWWTKLLFAQALPLAASLQGLECLHAACVALDGRAYALSAPSGTGKSSVALHLATSGARLVCDDILAAEVGGGRVSVHAGPGFTAADPAELAVVPADARPGTITARDDPKTYVLVEPEPGPLPLDRIYFLRREPGAAALAIRPLADARPVLGSRFLSYLDGPEQLVRHLETAAAIAASVDVVEVLIPAGVPAVAVASAVAEHAGSER